MPWVSIVSMDSFYKVVVAPTLSRYLRSPRAQVLNKEELDLAHHNNYNFDIPAAFDFELMIASLKKLKDGKKIEVART